ncbi:hypothetical protein [Nocardiopsis lambiniae]|uniref:Uncharacterized protein n=1 Tax=Nocardiopsis lambiniae TaxID=3075539 RepID=A0ABU2M4H9_9ACTN|nr:hypothetical protein [Nocardiopsis sp. DSM 44743]MDT0327556.1 hypothetical protein [Nocardiopsis sp. DSM 44743]
MTSPSALPESADEFIIALDQEIRTVLGDSLSHGGKLSLTDGRRLRPGGDSPHEYVFSCERRRAPFGPSGFLVRRPGSRGPWHPAEAALTSTGRVHVVTEADLGSFPGDVLLREDRVLVPEPSGSGSAPHPRGLDPEIIGERLGAGLRARAEELVRILAAARRQTAVRDRTARARARVNRARAAAERIVDEVALHEAEANRARRALERVEAALWLLDRSPAPFTARVRTLGERARELRSVRDAALREWHDAVVRLTEADRTVAAKARERDHAIEEARCVPSSEVLGARIIRAEWELERILRMGAMSSVPACPCPRSDRAA